MTAIKPGSMEEALAELSEAVRACCLGGDWSPRVAFDAGAAAGIFARVYRGSPAYRSPDRADLIEAIRLLTKALREART